MQIKTELGMVEISDEARDALRAKLTESDPIGEINRIIRVAMQCETNKNTVANRLAVAILATEEIAKLVSVCFSNGVI